MEASLTSLPDELIELITKSLLNPEIYVLAATCKQMRRTISSIHIARPVDLFLEQAKYEFGALEDYLFVCPKCKMYKLTNKEYQCACDYSAFSDVSFMIHEKCEYIKRCKVYAYLLVLRYGMLNVWYVRVPSHMELVRLAIETILTFKAVSDQVYYSNSIVYINSFEDMYCNNKPYNYYINKIIHCYCYFQHAVLQYRRKNYTAINRSLRTHIRDTESYIKPILVTREKYCEHIKQ